MCKPARTEKIAHNSFKMGITESHLSMVKSGQRDVTMAFADLLCHSLQLSYNDVLIHPTVERQPSAREVLAMVSLDDGRPWPGKRLSDHCTRYQHHIDEKQMANRLVPLVEEEK